MAVELEVGKHTVAQAKKRKESRHRCNRNRWRGARAWYMCTDNTVKVVQVRVYPRQKQECQVMVGRWQPHQKGLASLVGVAAGLHQIIISPSPWLQDHCTRQPALGWISHCNRADRRTDTAEKSVLSQSISRVLCLRDWHSLSPAINTTTITTTSRKVARLNQCVAPATLKRPSPALTFFLTTSPQTAFQNDVFHLADAHHLQSSADARQWPVPPAGSSGLNESPERYQRLLWRRFYFKDCQEW